jgi:uncharacterized protein YjiS (DUF1127 family)
VSYRKAAKGLYSNHRNDAGTKAWLLASRDLTKGIIMNVARSFNNWRKYRQTVTELGRMSSRELQDLGINRTDIHSVARQSVAR